jgi:hypothetical protein
MKDIAKGLMPTCICIAMVLLAAWSCAEINQIDREEATLSAKAHILNSEREAEKNRKAKQEYEIARTCILNRIKDTDIEWYREAPYYRVAEEDFALKQRTIKQAAHESITNHYSKLCGFNPTIYAGMYSAYGNLLNTEVLEVLENKKITQ